MVLSQFFRKEGFSAHPDLTSGLRSLSSNDNFNAVVTEWRSLFWSTMERRKNISFKAFEYGLSVDNLISANVDCTDIEIEAELIKLSLYAMRLYVVRENFDSLRLTMLNHLAEKYGNITEFEFPEFDEIMSLIEPLVIDNDDGPSLEMGFLKRVRVSVWPTSKAELDLFAGCPMYYCNLNSNQITPQDLDPWYYVRHTDVGHQQIRALFMGIFDGRFSTTMYYLYGAARTESFEFPEDNSRYIERKKKKFRLQKKKESDLMRQLESKLRELEISKRRDLKYNMNNIALPDGLFCVDLRERNHSVNTVFSNELVRQANKENKERKYRRKKQRQAERRSAFTESDEKESDDSVWDEKSMDDELFNKEYYDKAINYISLCSKKDTLLSLREPPINESEISAFTHMKNKLDEFFNNTEWENHRNVADQIIDFIIMIYLMKAEKDQKKFVMLVHILLGKFGISLHHKLMVDTVFGIAIKIKNIWNSSRAHTESLSDDISSFSYSLKAMMSGGLIKNIRDLLVTLNAFKMFPSETAASISNYFGNIELPKDNQPLDMVSLLSTLLESIATLVRACEMYKSGIGLSDLLFTKDPVSQAISKAIKLINMQNMTYSGLPVPGYMCRRQFVLEAKDCLPILKGVLDKGNTFMTGYSQCRSLYFQLYPIYVSLQNLMLSETRTPPVFVVLFGQPGIGKSTIQSFIFRVYCDVKGIKYAETQVYHKNPFDTYCEGYDPISHMFWHIPELGCLKGDYVKNKGDEMVQQLTMLIDSNPVLLNMAFGDKGKTPFLAECGVLDTNNPDLNLNYLFNNPAAFRRRFLYVEPRVKKEFLKDTGVGIDFDKAKNSDSRLNDRYTFDIYVEDQVSVKESSRRFLLQNGEVDAAYDTLFKYFQKHIIREEQVKNARLSDVDVRYGTLESWELFRIVGHIYAKWLFMVNFVYWASFSISFTIMAFFTNTGGVFCEFFSAGINYVVESAIADMYGYYFDKWSKKVMGFILAANMLFMWYFSYPWKEIIWKLAVIALIAICIDGYIMLMIHTKEKRAIQRYNNAKMRLKNYLRGRLTQVYDVLESQKYFLLAAGGVVFVLNVALCALDFSQVRRHFYADDGELVSKQTGERFKLKGDTLVPVTVTEGSDFSNTSTPYKEMNVIEEMMEAGGSIKRSRGKLPDVWTVKSLKAPIPFSGDPSRLALTVEQSTRLALVRTSYYETKTIVLGIKGNIILLNTHALPTNKNENFLIKICVSGIRDGPYKETLITKNFRIDLGNDVSLLSVSGMQFKDITKHICTVEFNSASGFIGRQITHVISVKSPFSADNKRWEQVVTNRPLCYSWRDHGMGKCGTPIIISVGNTAAIVGIHFAAAGEDRAFGTQLNKEEIESGIGYLCGNNTVPIFSESNEVHSLADPVPKSPVNYMNLDNIEYIGYDSAGILPNTKSRLKKSKIHQHLGKLFDILNFKPTKNYVPPLMKPMMNANKEWISPYNTNLEALNAERKALNRDKLLECCDAWLEKIVPELQKRGRGKLSPLDVATAVNGDVEDPYLRRINASTGAGYGFKGKKSRWLPIVKETENNIIREPVEEVISVLNAKFSMYANNETNGTIFGSKLKDEPRPLEKALKGKTRMFYPAPVDFLISARMVLGPLFTLMVENGDLFYTSVGINMHADGGKFFEKMLEFAESDLSGFELDYKNFDTSMPWDIAWITMTFLYKLAKLLGYSERALEILAGVLNELLWTYVEVNGDIFKVCGLQPSGTYGTAEMNCIRNVFLILYYFACHPNLKLSDFFLYVLLSTYGDDLSSVVKEKIKQYFNMKLYAKFIKDEVGMTVTTSSKGEIEEEFINVHDMSFLKRTFIKHPENGNYVAILDMESIYRMLYWTMPSENTTEYDQLVSTYNSALWELYLHLTRSKWIEFKNGLKEIILEEDINFPVHDLVDYSRIENTLCPIATPLREEEGVVCENENFEAVCQSERLIRIPREMFSRYKLDRSSLLNRGLCTLKQWFPANDEIIKKMTDESEEYKFELDLLIQEHKEALENFDGLHPFEVRNMPLYSIDEDFRMRCDKYCELYSKKESLELTIKLLNKYIQKLKHGIVLQTESDEISTLKIGKVSTEKLDKHENVEDVGGDEVKSVQMDTKVPRYISDNGLAMAGFLERPVQIDARSLSLNSDIDITLNIWNLFLANPTVRSKLRNFAFLKCDLGVKIAISGTPFHYGRLLISYQPFPSVNQNLVFLPSWRSARLRYLSQAIGCKTMDIKDNAPLEIHIPYISPQPLGRLYNDSAVALATTANYNDFSSLGNLYISTLNQIKAVSTTATNVYMYVYVYAKNVVLNGATGSVTAITTESDEREIGPVEKVTSALLPYSKALEQVPSIGIFARASSIALGALNKVSAMFGWSYPTLIATPHRMRPDPWQSSVNTIGYDTGKRLTLDPKQEVTVDPRIVAVDEDELAIAAICKKEGLLDTFIWEPVNAPLVTVVWSAAVTPRASLTDIVGVVPNHHVATVPTPLGFAATPFHYWRGSIKYRFEIVASNFHRGKLMFFYEPNIRHYSLVAAGLNVNKQYTKVIDIQETQVVEFCVDWNFPRMWAENISDSLIPTTVGTQFTNGSSKFDTCNGVIVVTPFTALQSPDGSSISINVYVSSDDMHFNRYTSVNYPLSIQPYTQSDERTLNTKALDPYSCMDMAPSVMDGTHRSMLHFGEQPISFRAILKRFQQGVVVTASAIANGTVKEFILPTYLTNTYGTTVSSGGAIGTSEVKTLHNYLRFAYLGQRGGIRHRIRVLRNTGTVGDFRILVSLKPDSSVTVAPVFINGGTGGTARVDMDGTEQYLTTVNNGIEFEIPFYSNNLFLWACNSDPYFSTALSNFQIDNMRNYDCWIEGLESSNVLVNEVFAAGEDFTFLRWLGAPPVRISSTVL